MISINWRWFLYFGGAWVNYLARRRTYSGRHEGQIIWLDGAAIHDATFYRCLCIHAGIAPVRAGGRVLFDQCHMVLRGGVKGMLGETKGGGE